MMPNEIIFLLVLFTIALLYSSVGHGGASGYLALMALFSFSPSEMRYTALILNIIVASLAFINYYHKGFFKWSLFWPFAIGSIPFAFIGGYIQLEDHFYKKIIGFVLILSVLKILIPIKNLDSIRSQNIVLSIAIGAIIGIISGMIGIGGGIILSPVILILHWANVKEAAATSALFIVFNSIAGIAGIDSTSIVFNHPILPICCIALLGGWLGSFLGAYKIERNKLQVVLSAVIMFAALKLLWN